MSLRNLYAHLKESELMKVDDIEYSTTIKLLSLDDYNKLKKTDRRQYRKFCNKYGIDIPGQIVNNNDLIIKNNER
jgi:hypothetical protein